MQNWYIHGRYRLTSTGVNSINRSSMELRNDHPKLANAELIWTPVAQPKHRFIMWLAIQNRLLTRERLGKLNILVEESTCCLCDNQVTELVGHLFNGCPWFQEVKKGVEQWTGLQLPLGSLRTVLQCIKKKKWKKFQRELVAATWGAMVYHTWKARNWKLFKGIHAQAAGIVIQIKREILARVDTISSPQKAHRCMNFIEKLQM
ncbi:uncharacterized protein [Nicotiana sylvestris]|uniref:Uncharacterized protein LOC104227560 n=1 Tax=Nicotiana sylvestris TaxID=4096 RepID=A0A1U7WV64_NICSY|nr:PREDICTED: uncharacterized protein LOC104227560 [Nicotiana sylvestris]